MYSQGNAIYLQSGSNIHITNCKIGNSGLYGIYLQSTINSFISRNEVFFTGSGGIRISSGNRNLLTFGNVIVEHNYVHDIARIDRCYTQGIIHLFYLDLCVAISFGGCGNIVRNNTLMNGPHIAIGGGGNNCLVEYNYVANFCYETSDAAVKNIIFFSAYFQGILCW